MTKICIAVRICLICLGLACGTTLSTDRPVRAADEVRFNRDIRPILSDKCFLCHGPDASHREAELRFDVRESAVEDRGGYYVIAPGKPNDSEFMARITSDDSDVRMPPADSGKELTSAEIELLKMWIDQGAPYEDHWSFIPLSRPDVPAVGKSTWPKNDADRFLLGRFEAEGLQPAPDADRVTLARRLHFDLVGLPPQPEVISAFKNDKKPGAYERLVDDLLASPHFGERMAMYWLDLVRYADTVGYHGDQDHSIAPYRDWVIHAFNSNMPFDQFTREQLAGDLLPDSTDDQKIASGYNRVLQTSHEGGVQEQEYLTKYSADRVRNISGVWMGATMGCAECHNHKYDPYTQKDFYSLAAFFADIDEKRTFKGGNTLPTSREPEMVVLSPLDRQRLAPQITKLQSEIDALRKADSVDVEQLTARLVELGKLAEEIESRKRRTMVTASVEPRTIRVLNRGDWMDKSGEIVEPAVPQFLQPIEVTERRLTRLDLADWLTAPDHPQTSRVFVNRLWYLFFGGGLCPSLDDNGSQGQWPTHPELLDWLASEFVDSGWDIKHVIRLIVTSRTYQQSSLPTAGSLNNDPSNLLFARQSRYRLPAEVIRDNALAISGLLVDEVGGATSRPYQPAGYYAHLNFPTRKYNADGDKNQYRRGVYMHWQRQFLHPMLKAFDAPTREECTAERPISNTPLAAMTLLNDPTFLEASRVFAQRMISEGGKKPEQRIRWAWREALSREPQSEEVAVLHELYDQNFEIYKADNKAAQKLLGIGLADIPQEVDAAELAAWTAVSRTIFNLSEFVTRN